jgi:hypothetical protein
MFGSAGSIMSIASGLSAIIDAITITNSGKPIGRWPEAAKVSARVSDNQKSFVAAILSVLLHCTIRVLGMAARPGRALNGPSSALAGRKPKPLF